MRLMRLKEYSDRRGKRIVLCSHCLLNQNTRFPGIAIEPGGIRLLVKALLDEGFGIEQLPCPEMKYWGGANRNLVAPMIVLGSRLIGTPLEFPFNALLRVFWRAYRALCAIEAYRVSRTIRSLAAGGHEITGIIAMNDSPTCGLDRTMKIPEALFEAKRLGVDWSRPVLDKLSRALPMLLSDGSGPFLGSLKRRVEKGGLQTRFLGFNPWKEIAGEVEQIMDTLRDPLKDRNSCKLTEGRS